MSSFRWNFHHWLHRNICSGAVSDESFIKIIKFPFQWCNTMSYWVRLQHYPCVLYILPLEANMNFNFIQNVHEKSLVRWIPATERSRDIYPQCICIDETLCFVLPQGLVRACLVKSAHALAWYENCLYYAANSHLYLLQQGGCEFPLSMI